MIKLKWHQGTPILKNDVSNESYVMSIEDLQKFIDEQKTYVIDDRKPRSATVNTKNRFEDD